LTRRFLRGREGPKNIRIQATYGPQKGSREKEELGHPSIMPAKIAQKSGREEYGN